MRLRDLTLEHLRAVGMLTRDNDEACSCILHNGDACGLSPATDCLDICIMSTVFELVDDANLVYLKTTQSTWVNVRS